MLRSSGFTAIRVEGLGKRYRIGAAAERHDTFRDAAMAVAKAPLRNLRRLQGLDTSRDRGESSDTVWALRDVSFAIGHGEVVGIIGRNGAGKSTLLKVLSRITEPTSGRVELRGRVGALLEVGTGFHPELTGRENIFLNGSVLGMERSRVRARFDEIVAFAGVERFIDTPVKRYSSGMYLRLAFAVAAHLEPDILVVDEVLAVGDAAFQRKCLGKMGEVAGAGRTVLFVSHNMAAVSALCERCILLSQGEVEADGRPPEIIERYLQGADSIGAVDLSERSDRKGDGRVRATGMRFSGGPVQGHWVTGEPARIELSYTARALGERNYVEVALGIKRMDETPLLYLGTKVVRQDVDLSTSAGRFLCEIPRLPLEPGRYLVDTEIKLNGEIVDRVAAAGQVDVETGDFYGTGVLWPYGGVLTEYMWTHEPLAGPAGDRRR